MATAVGFVGLDEVSLELAASLLRSGYSLHAFETSRQLMNDFVKLGGKMCANLTETKQGVNALVILISHADQINDLFYGDEGVLKGLPKDVIIIIHSTIFPVHIEKLEKSLSEDYQINIIVDMYALKAVSEVSNGKVMIISSGRSESISRAEPFLSAMGDKLFLFEGDIGAGSKSKMIIELLEGIHLVASLEAISLGAQAGIHPWIIYDIISNAAGNSWVFKNYIPNLLRSNPSTSNLFSAFNQTMGIVLEMAKSLIFPLPLTSVAHQQILAGCSHGVKDGEHTTLLKVWEELSGVNIIDAAKAKLYNPEELAKQLSAKSKTAKRIGFIGLGAMGFGMATHLLKSNFTVLGYDVYKPSLSRFENKGGIGASSPAEVCKDVDVLVLMVTNEYQAESVLFGENGAVAALPSGATIILSSTVSPSFVRQLERRLLNEQNKFQLVDAPVSGGVKRAADGTLTIMASGADDALEHAGSVLSALSEKLYIINGGCGAGSGVKMINQLLAGVHIASAAEAMAFAARSGLNTSQLFDVITISAGTSWMFENRGPHMVENDYTPLSALDIFVKDLGIVSHEGSSHKVPLHLSNGAHQLFLSGSAAGWGRIDDSSVVKVYETLTGVKVEGKPHALSKKIVLGSLPPEWPTDPIEDIISLNQKNSKTLVVLDDDPTGTQTVHDIDVLTEWSIESLVEQFGKRSKSFFILTNSRSMNSEKASALIKEICSNLSAAAKIADNAEYTVVLRGDSTLRGHFPEEADAASSVIGAVDAWIICPFFLQGGRYTIGDIHYVADADSLLPAGQTEFSKDASFGYRSSNLREWVEEKTRGRVAASSVASISIQLLRKGGPRAVCEHLCSLKKGSTCIVNAASERDMAVFAAGMIQAELKGKSFLCRTAASFVSTRVGIIPKAPVLPHDLILSRERVGGLIVVGSYVPKTTKQVEELMVQRGQALKIIEVSVDKIAAKSIEEREQEIKQAADMADVYLRSGKDTLVVTSRQLVVGKTASESLEINCKVSSGIVEIVRRITTRPRYILAKGGITSSDLATKALEAKRARVVGQALAGIPLWQLGPESKHPGIPYIVFPGNVGDNKAVAEVVKNWAHPGRLSAKELLLNAEKGGYAIGAFNVYNLEGVQAVVAAAEEQRSPAILQIHPSAFKQGGPPLVASCIHAAEQARVPITVHFDHGNSKQELLEILEMGFDSIMADGSHLSFKENIAYTKYLSVLAHSKDLIIEAELGRLSGTEDDLTVEDYEARLTDVIQANEFIDATGIDALAVCIGNVHGKYPASGPKLRLDLLKDMHDLTSKKGVHLVLHGASGLDKDVIEECIKRGVRKFNVNTEVRKAYMNSLTSTQKDLVHVMTLAKEAMKAVVAEKMRLFGSAGKV
ncbi:ketose-bisphosphate aldolase class-II family protein [Perilla frutescens var. hirtella]|nr:ketose-bisphosphate aldolase class-II family protein [Perilla frutescens var. frutescens]KAH6800817.1 ketose-bisphosphate aldolase class-II family protein [Perilla frutescens var. hirtella]